MHADDDDEQFGGLVERRMPEATELRFAVGILGNALKPVWALARSVSFMFGGTAAAVVGSIGLLQPDATLHPRVVQMARRVSLHTFVPALGPQLRVLLLTMLVSGIVIALFGLVQLGLWLPGKRRCKPCLGSLCSHAPLGFLPFSLRRVFMWPSRGSY